MDREGFRTGTAPKMAPTRCRGALFSPRSYGYARARQARQFTLLHGPAQGPLEVKWFANDTLWKIEYLDSAARGGALKAVATTPVKSLRLEFKGKSPDFYGLAMDGTQGISVDNVAMRGADGLSFSRMDRAHFIQSLQRQPVALVILQFEAMRCLTSNPKKRFSATGRRSGVRSVSFRRRCQALIFWCSAPAIWR